jgi:hypothetical protein
MKVLAGFALGLLVVVLLGATYVIEKHEVQISGRIDNSTIIYQSTFSGITPDGVCYLAITDVMTGRTELFKITESLGEQFDDVALRRGQDGRVLAFLSEPRRRGIPNR